MVANRKTMKKIKVTKLDAKGGKKTTTRKVSKVMLGGNKKKMGSAPRAPNGYKKIWDRPAKEVKYERTGHPSIGPDMLTVAHARAIRDQGKTPKDFMPPAAGPATRSATRSAAGPRTPSPEPAAGPATRPATRSVAGPRTPSPEPVHLKIQPRSPSPIDQYLPSASAYSRATRSPSPTEPKTSEAPIPAPVPVPVPPPVPAPVPVPAARKLPVPVTATVTAPEPVTESMDAKDTLAEEIQSQVDGAIEVFNEASRLDKKGDSYKKAQSDDNAKRAWHNALEKIDEVITIMQQAVSRGYPSEAATEDEANINQLKSEIMAKLDAQELQEQNQELQAHAQKLQEEVNKQISARNRYVGALEQIKTHFETNQNLTRQQFNSMGMLGIINLAEGIERESAAAAAAAGQ